MSLRLPLDAAAIMLFFAATSADAAAYAADAFSLAFRCRYVYASLLPLRCRYAAAAITLRLRPLLRAVLLLYAAMPQPY